MDAIQTIMVPQLLNKDSIPRLVSEVMDNELHPLAPKIDFNLTEVIFCEPSGVVALNNLINWLNSKNMTTTFHIDKTGSNERNHKAMCYLEDCGFFVKHFPTEGVFKKPNLRKTTLPLNDLKVEGVASWSESALIPFLQRNTGRHSNNFSNIRVAVEEIYNNINDHSTEKVGSAFGQFFPKKNSIVLVFSDFGVGIPKTMSRKFTAESDKAFLELAFKEGISTRSTPRNRGAGISNISRAITANNLGTVHLKSNYGKIVIKDKDIFISEDEDVFYPGTFYQLEIDVANESLYDDEEEEEFEW